MILKAEDASSSINRLGFTCIKCMRWIQEVYNLGKCITDSWFHRHYRLGCNSIYLSKIEDRLKENYEVRSHTQHWRVCSRCDLWKPDLQGNLDLEEGGIDFPQVPCWQAQYWTRFRIRSDSWTAGMQINLFGSKKFTSAKRLAVFLANPFLNKVVQGHWQ